MITAPGTYPKKHLRVLMRWNTLPMPTLIPTKGIPILLAMLKIEKYQWILMMYV
jgi:hypothetical protein